MNLLNFLRDYNFYLINNQVISKFQVIGIDLKSSVASIKLGIVTFYTASDGFCF